MMTDEEKWQFLYMAPTRDAREPVIEALASLLSRAAKGSAFRVATLAMTVARDWIRQTSDVERTGGEDIAGLTRLPGPNDATEALSRGADDCDAKARVFVALCLAAGVAARMVPKWNMVAVSKFTPLGRTLTHVSAEVLIGSAWLPVELTLARARLGETGEGIPFEIGTKKWRLA